MSSGSRPGAKRGPIRPQPPFLDQQDLVAVDGDRLVSAAIDRERDAPAASAVFEQAEVGSNVPAFRIGIIEVSVVSGAVGVRPRSGSAAGGPFRPCQTERKAGQAGRCLKTSSQRSPRLRRTLPIWVTAASSQIGVAGCPACSAMVAGLACRASWAVAAGRAAGISPARGCSRQVRPKPRAGSGRKIRGFMARCGPCSRWISPAIVPTQSVARSGHFFAANRQAHAISPPPAASRPVLMLFTRAWRNW